MINSPISNRLKWHENVNYHVVKLYGDDGLKFAASDKEKPFKRLVITPCNVSVHHESVFYAYPLPVRPFRIALNNILIFQ